MSERDVLWELAPELFGVADEDSSRLGLGALLEVLTARPGERPEDVLLDLKLVDDTRLALALAQRSGRRYEGLRGLVPDERLFLYLPLPLALQQRLVPVLLTDDTLTIASAFLDPDLSYVQARFPNLRLALIVSPRSEILEALRRVGS